MFTFTKKTDYALLALSYLAGAGADRLVGPREIASHYEIPGELLAKVMQTLARASLVSSVPGPAGGYRLAMPAARISIGAVLEAVDGPLAIAQCWDDTVGGGCAQAERCHLRGPLARIQDQIAALLRSTTLADVADGANDAGRRRYGTAVSLDMAPRAATSDAATN
ncbi:MAG: RrF2 family transcriptional regulator [Armatimonadota bacterium]